MVISLWSHHSSIIAFYWRYIQSSCLFTLLSCFFILLKVWTVSRSVTSDSLRPLDYNPPGSSVHGIFYARILEWVAISYFRGSPQPRDQTQDSHITGRFFTIWVITLLIVNKRFLREKCFSYLCEKVIHLVEDLCLCRDKKETPALGGWINPVTKG